MAFTKVTAAGIGTTQPLELTGVNLAGVVTATGLYVTGISTFTGNVSIAGTLTYEDVTNVDAVGLITARAGIEFGTRPGLGASISDIGNAVFAGVVTATSYYGDGSNLTGIDATQIVTGNTSVQTVDTGSDGHIKFNTEGSEVARFDSIGRFGLGTASPGSFATSDADNLVIGSNSGDNGLTIVSQSGNYNGTIRFSDGTSGADQYRGTIQYYHGDDYMRFLTNGTERVRIDSSGRLLVGTNSGTSAQAIITDGLQVTGAANDGNTNRLTLDYSGSTGRVMSHFSTGSEVAFFTNASGSGLSERARIDSSGRMGLGTISPQANLHIGNGTGNGVEINNNGTLQIIDRGNSRLEPLTVVAEHVAFSIARNTSTTLHDERARITYNGLTFNGDTAAANALDDYEEGTWTPVFRDDGNATYSQQIGRYVKIGAICNIWLHLQISSFGTATSGSNLRVDGLPFTAANIGSLYGVGSSVHGTNWNVARRSINSLVAPNASNIDFYHNMTGTNSSSNPSITGSDWGAIYLGDIQTGNLLLSLQYFVN